jgi:DNA-binding protein Fis
MQALLAKPRKAKFDDRPSRFPEEIQETILMDPARRTPFQWHMFIKAKAQVTFTDAECAAALKGDAKARYAELERQLAAFDSSKPPELPVAQLEGLCPESQSLLETYVTTWTTEKLQQLDSLEQKNPSSNEENPLPGTLYEDFLNVVEPSLLKAVLDHHAGNRAAAASTLGLHRSTLRQKTRRYRLEPDK